MNGYHRVSAEIDTSALLHNISQVRKKVGKNVKIMPVIKANAYGHGAAEVAHVLENDADFFAVAVVEEAAELRNIGIKKPIIILSYVSPKLYPEVIENDVTLTIFGTETARILSEEAKRAGKISKIHIAVDTGMNRIGFYCSDEAAENIKEISKMPNLFIEGIFSHFATADEVNKEFSVKQKNKFMGFCNKLENEGIKIPIKHICNSAAVMDFDDCYFDMVRSGIITYGLYPSDEVNKKALDLMPALSLKSHVSFIKTVKKGEGISYGQTYIADRDMPVATIPVGYADGYPRLLSNKGRVLINGRFAPILGRVCMDQMMVDISHIKNVSVEDIVTLIGRDGNEVITCEEIASLAQTINYEVICSIGKRVPRIYK